MINYTKQIYGTIDNVVDNNIIGGFYGSDTVDVDGHIIFKEDYMDKMAEYVEWGNVRNSHKEPVGILSSYDPNSVQGWNYLEVKISDNKVMDMARDGVYKGFSIGIKADETGLQRVPLSQIDPSKYSHLPSAVIKRLKRLGYVLRIKDFYISEISITDRPKNTKSKIILLKSEDSDGSEIPSLVTEDFMEQENLETTNEMVEDTNPENVESNIDKGESEAVIETPQAEVTNDEPVTEDVSVESVDKGETIEESVEIADSNSSSMEFVKSINDEIGRLSGEIASLMTLVKSVETKFEAGVANLAAISKSDTVEVEAPALDIEALKSSIADIVKSELENFNKSEYSPERKNTINKGESGEEEVEPLDVTTMEKGEAYSVIASIIAKNLKK